jgi:hypothetical protein
VHALDARFGKANKTVISQRDVPGVTRGIVPLMHQRGVKAFSEGCNAQVRKMRTQVLKSERDSRLAQNLGQLQPFTAGFPQECMGQLASFGPT